MRLATLPNGTRDGALAVVSRDNRLCVGAAGVAPTLLAALEGWDKAAPALNHIYEALCAGERADARPFDAAACLAPLPRAPQWLDGSAFASHGQLMQKAFNLAEDPAADGLPLMYQGLSDRFLAPTDDVPLPSEADGIDFEGEFAVVVGEVPMGTPAGRAAGHIRLLLQINDWSLRALGPREMKTGFGFLQAKPACSTAPVAVTPDELGGAWRDGRIDLALEVRLDGQDFGRPNGAEMGFSFGELIAHACRSRTLPAGTIVGSGTVSNADARTVGSACIAERRMIEMIEAGQPATPFMHFGHRVRMECRLADGAPLFGPIDQRVVRAPTLEE